MHESRAHQGEAETGGRLVGRHREIAQIERALDRVSRGRPQLVQVTGEIGIGKTRLLSHAADRARRRGAFTLAGRAAEFERDEPFALFLEPLERLIRELSERAIGRLADAQLRELASLFPEAERRLAQRTGRAVPPPRGSGLDRYRLHRAVAELLDVVAGDRRIFMAIDDLHWADASSLEMLLHLLRRPPSAALLVVVAYRSRQLEPETASALRQAQGDSRGVLLELQPLTVEQAATLIPAELPRSSVEHIYRDSGGNPLYLEELVRAAERGRTRSAAGERELAPAALSAIIAGEVDRLRPRGRELIRAASVIGDPFEPEIAGEIVGMRQDETYAALDELVDRSLIQATPPAGWFMFRHPIVRRAVYGSVGEGWRRSAHGRAAAVLVARGAPAIARARHVERSARFGDLDAVAVLAEAGYATNARAPAASAAWFRAALRLLPAHAAPAQRLELTAAMALALGSAGDLVASRDAFHEVLTLLAPAQRPAAIRAAALVEHLLGNHDQAQGLLLASLPDLGDRSAEAAKHMLEIAEGCFFSADWQAMRGWAREALDVPEAPSSLRAGAGASLALADYGCGDLTAAQQATGEASRLADRLPDGDWVPHLKPLAVLGWAEYCLGRFSEAEQHVTRALAICRQTGQEHLSTAFLVVQAMSNLALGRLSVAREQADTAIDICLLSANQLFLTWALTTRCMVEIDAGSAAAAVGLGQRALEVSGKSHSVWSTPPHLYLAEAWLESGDPERCRVELLTGQGGPRLPPLQFYAVHAYEILARAEIGLNQPERAADWADQAVGTAERLGLPGPRAEALRARAFVLLSSGEADEASDLARTSAQEAERASQPVQAARSRLLAGVAMRAAGRDESAIAELRLAKQTLTVHGAARYRDHAARELRALGVFAARGRSPIPAEGSLELLSERELIIARLVHEGQTNQQIALELSLSVKTIENHLTKAFRRLGISSRAQLATLVERSSVEA
jgi:DNA-binding NarL/FixJ family response regulator